jgi:hypothetical protein
MLTTAAPAALTMPKIPVSETVPAKPRFTDPVTKRFMPMNPIGGPSAPTPGTDQAREGVTMLKDPKLSILPAFIDGKRYKDMSKQPLTGDCKDGARLDEEIWVPHVAQGALGDCWFMGTLASMALAKDSKYHPGIRRIDDEHVAVKFGDRLYGVTDDLPMNTRKEKFLYGRINKPHFQATWPAYYEKAAAALVGGYKKLDGGWPREAFGIILGQEPREVALPQSISKYINAAVEAGLPVAVTTKSSQTEQMDDAKLHSNHTYAVRTVKLGTADGQSETKIKLWNPWGDSHPRYISAQEFVDLCDTVTTPNEWFGWGGRG